jgi:hypothetical protein
VAIDLPVIKIGQLPEEVYALPRPVKLDNCCIMAPSRLTIADRIEAVNSRLTSGVQSVCAKYRILPRTLRR